MTSLDNAQQAAVEAGPGPLVIVAGAGSGKTRVLTTRIARMVTTQTVAPTACFVSAFTVSAANEMAERLRKIVYAPGLNVGTFHRLAYMILRQERELAGLAPLEVCRDAERKRFLRGLLGPPKPDFPHAVNLDADLGLVSGQISAWKNNLISDSDEVVRDAEESASLDLRAAARIYPLYQDALARENKLDFDDMLSDFFWLLSHDEDALARTRRRWSAFFVDESQDTAHVQWEILALLAPPESRPNLTLVGDPRQSIYAWRSAQPEGLLEACERWGAQRIDLVSNYRSLPPIVAGANALIRPLELPDLVPARDGGPEIVSVSFLDPTEQGVEIARLVGAVRDAGAEGSAVAVLVRTNAQTGPIERAFTASGLPYWCGDGGAFGRLEARDMLSYLRLAVDPTDRESLRRIINRPTRYLGEAFVAEVAREAGPGGDLVQTMPRITHTASKALNAKQMLSAAELAEILRTLGRLSPAVAIATVLARTGYLPWLRRHEGSALGADEDRSDNLVALIETAKGYSTIAALLGFVDECEAMLRNSTDATIISTVHRAKGQEWPVVIVAGCSEDSMPHKKAVAAGATDEERRVAYVATTRARDMLVLCSPLANDKGEEVAPSPYLAEMGLTPRPASGPLWSLIAAGQFEAVGVASLAPAP